MIGELVDGMTVHLDGYAMIFSFILRITEAVDEFTFTTEELYHGDENT